jgi:hypothetical protein
MMVAMMGMDNHHDLRLRRVRRRETTNEKEREQNLFHVLSIRALVIRWLSYSDLRVGVIAAKPQGSHPIFCQPLTPRPRPRAQIYPSAQLLTPIELTRRILRPKNLEINLRRFACN